MDVPIFVTALGLYGSLHGPFLYHATIEITDFSSNKLVAVNETSFQCDGSASVFRVPFKEPVEILANVTYEASATIKVSSAQSSIPRLGGLAQSPSVRTVCAVRSVC